MCFHHSLDFLVVSFQFPFSPSPEAETAFAGTGEGIRKIDAERLLKTVAEAARKLDDSGLSVLSNEDLAHMHPRIAGLTNGTLPRVIEFRASCILNVHYVNLVVKDQFCKKGFNRQCRISNNSKGCAALKVDVVMYRECVQNLKRFFNLC